MENKRHIFIVLFILVLQILSESFHLFFESEVVQNNIFFLNLRALHIGLLPSIAIWYFVKGRIANMLAFCLFFYQVASLIMEIVAILGHEELITQLNSYYYSELIFVLLSMYLAYLGKTLWDGVHICNNNKHRRFYILPFGCFKKGEGSPTHS